MVFYGERGSASLIVMAMFFVIVTLGYGAVHITSNNLRATEAYTSEMKLKMFAKGESEKLAVLIVTKKISVPQGYEGQLIFDKKLDDMICDVYVKDRTDGIEIVAVAQRKDTENEKSYRKVHGFVQKVEGKQGEFAWAGWITSRPHREQ